MNRLMVPEMTCSLTLSVSNSYFKANYFLPLGQAPVHQLNSEAFVGDKDTELHVVSPPRIPSHVFPTRHQGAAIISRH